MRTIVLSAAALAIAGCGDKSKTAANGADSTESAGLRDYRKDQQHYADSVLAAVKGPTDVVKRLGKTYDLPSERLRDTVVMLATKAKCFEQARQVDPYLQGVATIWVNMSTIGSDLIQVLDSDTKWTSPAGGVATTCLNRAAATWKLDMSFGKKAGYIVQIQYKTDPNATKAAPVAPVAAPAKKARQGD